MNLKSLLSRYSVAELQQAIRLGRTQGQRDKLEAERDTLKKKLDRVERKLAALDGNGAATTAAKPGGRGRRKGYKLSARTRARMRASALARHRKTKPDAAKPERKTRKLSAAGRAAISAAAKARWEKLRASKPQAAPIKE